MYKVIGGDHKEYGPVSAEEVRRWIAERRLQPNSLIQAEGSGDWKPLSSFLEFAGALAALHQAASVAAAPVGAMSEKRSNSMATTGLVLSCLSLICCGCGGPLPILGIVFSCIGLSQANHDPLQTGRPLAIAGIVIGVIALIETAIGWLVGILPNLH